MTNGKTDMVWKRGLTLMCVLGAFALPLKSAEAMIPTIDTHYLEQVISKIENVQEQIDKMKQQAERFQKMQDSLGNGGAFAFVQSMAGQYGLTPEALIPDFPAELENLQNNMGEPEDFQEAMNDELFTEETTIDENTAEELSAEIRNEVDAKRLAMLNAAITTGYGLALTVRNNSALIDETCDTLRETAGNSSDINMDLGANTGIIVEIVKQVSTLVTVLASQLEIKTARMIQGF